MKTFLGLIFSIAIFFTEAQDIPYMSGKIDYLNKGDSHLSDSSLYKALSSYEKGLKKRPDDSLVYAERIAFVRSLLGEENNIASLEKDKTDQSEEPMEILMKSALFDLETLTSLSGSMELRNSNTGEVLSEVEDGVFYVEMGEEYNLTGQKEGYNDVSFSFVAEEQYSKEKMLLATSKIQENEIVKVQYEGGRIMVFELSNTVFFERTSHTKNSEDYFIESIYFDFDKAGLSENTDLSSLVALMKKYDHLKLEIRGFTDSRGRSDYNKELSKSRTESVVKKLVSMDVARQRLILIPLGEEQLVSCPETQCTELEHAKNRRVDFALRSELQNHRQLSMLNE